MIRILSNCQQLIASRVEAQINNSTHMEAGESDDLFASFSIPDNYVNNFIFGVELVFLGHLPSSSNPPSWMHGEGHDILSMLVVEFLLERFAVHNYA